MNIHSFDIIRPDDWHVHFRQEDVMRAVVPLTASRFGRALVMPNTVPPITTAEAALKYREKIIQASGSNAFDPKMALFLTDSTTTKDVEDAAESEHILAFKYYPAGATTNSDNGVTSLDKAIPILKAMQENGVVLCLHGEVNRDAMGRDVDIFYRERRFMKDTLPRLLEKFPSLKVVLEHISTKEAADAVRSPGSSRLAATITPHHMMYERNDMFAGGLRPGLFCYPVLKSYEDSNAVYQAAMSGHPRIFAGTDSAPHSIDTKHSGCCPGGVLSAHCAIEMYAHMFSLSGKLDKLEKFLSKNGAEFYGLEPNKDHIRIVANIGKAASQSKELAAARLKNQFEDTVWKYRVEEIA